MTAGGSHRVPVDAMRADRVAVGGVRWPEARPATARRARWAVSGDIAPEVPPHAVRTRRGAPVAATGGRGHVDQDHDGPREPHRGASTVLVLGLFVVLGPALDGAALAGRVTAVALSGLLTVYRRGISPLLGPRCRFHPTCSAYALDALAAHGALRGTVMTLVRLAKCGPWHPGGLDPVPSRAHRPTGPGAPITEEQAL